MKKQIAQEAQIPNPALQQLGRLIGEWETIGTHPLLPNTIFHGRTSFQWLEGGAFLMIHSEIDEEGIPSGISILAGDDATGDYFMLYFDERKISRKYDLSFHDNVFTWQRNAPGFSQRFNWTLTDNDNTIISKGQYTKNGISWEDDLELTFTRSAGKAKFDFSDTDQA
jgi:hypothetical protein